MSGRRRVRLLLNIFIAVRIGDIISGSGIVFLRRMWYASRSAFSWQLRAVIPSKPVREGIISSDSYIRFRHVLLPLWSPFSFYSVSAFSFWIAQRWLADMWEAICSWGILYVCLFFVYFFFLASKPTAILNTWCSTTMRPKPSLVRYLGSVFHKWHTFVLDVQETSLKVPLWRSFARFIRCSVRLSLPPRWNLA